MADGTIDIIATDHAPHPHEAKDCEWDSAAFGMLGLETALGVVVSAMQDVPDWNWRTLSDRMSSTPARIGRATNHGRPMSVGESAHLVLVDPDQGHLVVAEQLASLSGNTPYAGMTLPVSVTDVFFKGIHQVKDGALNV